MKIKRENKRSNMADKTEKAVDLGILEEDDEFEEFPAEDWKETNESELKNVSYQPLFISQWSVALNRLFENFCYQIWRMIG